MKIAKLAYLVRDYDEAKNWFVEKLGFAAIEDVNLGNGKRWVVVAPAGGGAALLLAKAAGAEQAARIGDQSGGRVFLFLETKDFERDHAKMTKKGVEFLESPRREPYGKVAVFKDLYGVKWDLIEPA
ncbi:MAG: extradiol dioxygenase [Alphaproteobacteria bacterium RIFCSPHIGHO2_12_FULL_63_12]|nr:MAG: extradiol dioxygenase [Alphaproteobacteria bacterium RIFCSPHIGHO2_12_FULL_63_12]